MQTRVTRSVALASVACALALGGCRGCGDPLAVQAAGSIVPPIFEFGPITKGSKCTANLQVKNDGREDLTVSGATLENTNGNFTLTKAPTLVLLGSSADLVVDYTAGDTVGKTESTGVKLQTDDPKNKGVLRGTVTAIVTDAAAPTAKSQCGDAPPCATLDFGATQLNGSGVVLGVTIINDGTADLHITPGGAVIQAGNAAFTIDSVTLGTTVVTDFDTNGVTIPPTRSGDCGKPTGSTVTATINVRFVPSQLGAAVDTLAVLTDAISSDGHDGGEVDVPLSGVGSDIGIITTPTVINFGALGEGDTQTIQVKVENVGTSDAPVNASCISLNNDGTCDANCTGQDGDSALNGTLTCKVTKADGSSAESYGFRLGATDAQAGGDDEREIFVTWSPVAGATSIPGTAVLALQSGILGNKVFTVPLVGGSVGLLTFSTTDGACPGGTDGLCIHTNGTACDCPTGCNLPADTETWAGSATARLTNDGAATVNISSLELDCPGGATVASEYTVGDPTQSGVAPGDHADVTVSFQNGGAACVAPCNLLVHHDGAGGLTTVPMDIVPPQ